MKKLLLLAGLALMVCSASAKKPAQKTQEEGYKFTDLTTCLLYTSPSPRDA